MLIINIFWLFELTGLRFFGHADQAAFLTNYELRGD